MGIPKLSELDVYNAIVKAKKPNSSVGCDINTKIVKTFSVELALPVSILFNNITRTQNFPQHWKMENGVAISKVKGSPPQSEGDLRIISKTPFMCKVYEAFVTEWILEFISPYLDPSQCGIKGLSITHYLIRFLHFIHSSLDTYKPHTVIAAFIHMVKAFNRVDLNFYNQKQIP